MATVAIPTLSLAPVTVKALRFEPLKDLLPVAGLVETRYVFVSPAKAPWKSFRDMMAYAKANPGKLNYGSSSQVIRIMMEVLMQGTGTDIARIDYNGGGPILQAIFSGDVHGSFLAESVISQAGDRMQILASTGDQSRPPIMEVPTFADTGVALVPVFSKTPLVALKDLAPVSLIAEGPLLMVVPKDLPANNRRELFNHVRANPGKLNHATVGPGSSISLYFEYWKAKEKLNMQTIAYPGPGPITTARGRTDIQMALLGVAVTKAFVDSGKGKAIAISGKKRLAEFPGAATFEDQGYPETGGTMVAMHAPAGVLREVIAKVHGALLQVGKSADFVKRMEAQNFVMVLSTPDELKKREEDDAKWSLDVARVAKIQPE